MLNFLTYAAAQNIRVKILTSNGPSLEGRVCAVRGEHPDAVAVIQPKCSQDRHHIAVRYITEVIEPFNAYAAFYDVDVDKDAA